MAGRWMNEKGPHKIFKKLEGKTKIILDKKNYAKNDFVFAFLKIYDPGKKKEKPQIVLNCWSFWCHKSGKHENADLQNTVEDNKKKY